MSMMRLSKWTPQQAHPPSSREEKAVKDIECYACELLQTILLICSTDNREEGAGGKC